jgi:hypothetical protein
MAQCQGTTRKGEQCKRDAREGDAFCGIHLDQAVRAPRAQEVLEWDRDAILAAALGFGIVAAIVFMRIK